VADETDHDGSIFGLFERSRILVCVVSLSILGALQRLTFDADLAWVIVSVACI
jgi:hypothetical protein